MTTALSKPIKSVTMSEMTNESLTDLFQDWIQSRSTVLCITDPFVLPARNRLISQLSQMGTVFVLENLQSDPKVAYVMKMMAEARSAKPDVILAIGGGSTLDMAKAVTMLMDNGGDLEEYLGPRPARTITDRHTRLIAIPTTAGTGSEVTRFGVYTSRTGRKYTLAHPALLPDMAVLIPELTYSLSPALTAGTGFDALSHALESLWNRNATEASIALATQAAIALLQSIELAWKSARTGEPDGRKEMLEAAHMAGQAFNMTGTAAVHAVSFVLSEEWQVPHGIACAFTLDDVLQFNARDPVVCERLSVIAKAFSDLQSPAELVNWLFARIVQLKTQMALPFTFSDLGVAIRPEAILPLFEKTLTDPKMANNAVPLSASQLQHMLALKL